MFLSELKNFSADFYVRFNYQRYCENKIGKHKHIFGIFLPILLSIIYILKHFFISKYSENS